MKWSPEVYKEVWNALSAKGNLNACKSCYASNGFDLIPGFFMQMIIQDPTSPPVPGEPVQAIPTVVTVCVNCGQLTQYAMGQVLGVHFSEEAVRVGTTQ